MDNVVLGKSGIRVSRICLGTMTFGNPVEEHQCRKLVSHALDRGVNFFDTSNVYEGYDRTFGSPGGIGEEMLGKALEGQRQRAVICTKYANPVGLGPLEAGLSARHLEVELENSLRRLRTDRIDVVLAHRADASVPTEEVWRVFDRWVQSGKVLCVGISNWPAWRIAQANEIASRRGWPPACVSSPKYNLLSRGAELEQIPCAVHYGMAVVAYQPYAGGMLTGKYRRGQAPPQGTRASERPAWLPAPDSTLFDKLEALENLAQSAGTGVPQYVISWLLSRKGIASIIVGCRTPEQLDTVLDGLRNPIPVDHLPKIDSVFPPAKPLGGEQILQWRDGAWRLEDLES
jgi:aryl-alcohol dehydrogenase-like predicted oxidoreductase